MGGAASEADPAGRDLDEEEDVEATQQDSVDGEEVAGQDSPRVSAEEIAPTHFAPSRSRWNPAVMKDAANRGRRHVDAELAQLALDPQIAPGWIVRGQAGDKIPRLGRDRGPAAAAWRGRPSPPPRLQARPPGGALEHAELVPQHQDLKLAVAMLARHQCIHEHKEYGVDHRQQHRTLLIGTGEPEMVSNLARRGTQ